MRLFNTRFDYAGVFLSELKGIITAADLERLAEGAGFAEPNEFDFRKIERCLKQAELPKTDFFEYGWSINECGVENLNKLSLPVKLFAAAIFLYCRRIEQFDGNIDSAYCHMVLQSVFENQDKSYANLFVRYVEWLYDCVETDNEANTYWLLMTWIFANLYIISAQESHFESVYAVLYSMHLSKHDIEIFNDCAFPRAEDWLELTDKYRICLSNQEEERVLSLLFGTDL